MGLKIEQNNLSSHAYNKIKLLILNNNLKPGEKIIQDKMAKKLGISKIPLLQALSILCNENLIDYKNRRGFYVRKIQKSEYINLIDIRSALESLAVEEVINNFNDEIQKNLLKFLEDFNKYVKIKDKRKYYEVDKKFHYFIIDKSNNYYLKQINNSFNILLLTFEESFRTEISASYEDHKNIIQSIIDKDKEKAKALISKHIENKKKSHSIN